MPTLPEIVPVTDLRQDAAGVLSRLRGSSKPLVITQRGRAAAVLLDLRAYEAAEQERAMLRALARGEAEIARGEGVDLADVLAEADGILAETPA